MKNEKYRAWPSKKNDRWLEAFILFSIAVIGAQFFREATGWATWLTGFVAAAALGIRVAGHEIHRDRIVRAYTYDVPTDMYCVVLETDRPIPIPAGSHASMAS